MKFPVVLHTDDGLRYGVTVPDLAGCFSAGDDLDDALNSAREAIESHVEILLEDGHDIPKCQPLALHQKNPDYANGVWALVDVPVEKYFGAAEKINITIPKRLLVQIDNCAKASGKSRSGFLADAARHALT
ncbi:MAG: type II toxin-antitoxin system HicB family antitoxin [Cytophagales bacterium]|nr:type II toxin-antitoxin system HicB family antitoxin [Cytophagales bacterium]